MTGSIQDILNRSHVVESMRMEEKVTNVFLVHGFASQRGVYYSDLETAKKREIDVYCNRCFDEPRIDEGVGAPIINLEIFCECKSLSGSNILFSRGSGHEGDVNYTKSEWIATGVGIENLVSLISDAANPFEINGRKLYAYIANRAYPADGRALSRSIKIPLPPIALNSTSFRETKNGTHHSTDDERSSPLWNAIRSNISALNAAVSRGQKTSIGWIEGGSGQYQSKNDFIRNVSFFLDAELLRFRLFHPMIVVQSRLWEILDSQVVEVSSARLHIKELGGQSFCMDIINYQEIEKYIEKLTLNYTEICRSSIENVYDRLETLGWLAGNSKKNLKKCFV